MSTFADRVQDWMSEKPLDVLTFTEAILFSRAVSTLLSLGVTEQEIRDWFDIVLREGLQSAALIDDLEQQLPSEEADLLSAALGKRPHGN